MGINEIAEKLRREPFRMFGNNCLRKSFKFKRLCHDRNIGNGADIGVILALVVTPCERFPLPPKVVWFHAWAEVDGQRIELARPLDERNTANTFDIDIKPVIAVRI